ncbi:MAG: hypothetical protein LM576_07885 [Thermofilum sp.]|nr:hypothetical protein [Thermofilum sp.]
MVKILVGDNPFLGISHLARERGREALRGLTLEKKVEVLKAAADEGASGFTFSTHNANLELLAYMRDNEKDLLKKLEYYVLTPYAAEYVRLTDVTGTDRLVKSIVIENLKKNPLKLINAPPYSIINLFIHENLNPYLEILPKQNVKAVLLHEVLSEILIAFKLTKIVKELRNYFTRLGVGFGMETRNIAILSRLLEQSGKTIEYAMTPMNPLGYQMGTKEEAEKAIIALSSGGVKVIAMNILASGACTIEESAAYLRQYRKHLYAVAFGTSKPERARSNTRCLNIHLNQQ